MWKQNPAVHHQDVALKVPEDDLVNSDIHETSSYRLGLKNWTYKGLCGSRILLYTIRMLLSKSLRVT